MFYDGKVTSPIQPRMPTPGVLPSPIPPDQDPRNWWQKHPKISRAIQYAVPIINTAARVHGGPIVPDSAGSSGYYNSEIGDINLPGLFYSPGSVGDFIEGKLNEGKSGYFSRRTVAYFAEDISGLNLQSDVSNKNNSAVKPDPGNNLSPGKNSQNARNKTGPVSGIKNSGNSSNLKQPSPLPSSAKLMQTSGRILNNERTEERKEIGRYLSSDAASKIGRDQDNIDRGRLNAIQSIDSMLPESQEDLGRDNYSQRRLVYVKF